MKIYKFLLLAILFLANNSIFAQAGAQSWMENTMYESGKINVVVAVVAIVFIGLIIFLMSLERRVRQMEKEIKNQ